MQTDKKILSVIIASALIVLLAGCPQIEESAKVIFNNEPPMQQQTADTLKRFQEPDPEEETIVNSAIELSKKCAELSEEKSVLYQKNLELTTESDQLKKKMAALEPQLEQAKKELAEANDLLIEMRIELNNWKSNIIGFRDEMRDADKYQLEALLKILKVLGGEVNTDKSQGQGQDSNAQPQIGQSELTSK